MLVDIAPSQTLVIATIATIATITTIATVAIAPRHYTVTDTVAPPSPLQLTYTKLRVRRMRLGMSWDDLGWFDFDRPKKAIQGIKRAEDNARNLNSKRIQEVDEDS